MFQKLSKIFLIGIIVCIAVYIGVFIGRTSSKDMMSLSSIEIEESSVRTIDLNTAEVADLKAIPGVSSSVAKEIVEYRKKYGKYYAVKELLDVDGVSQELYERIKPYVTVRD